MSSSTPQSQGSKSVERDAALGRIARTRRWLIAGAAGLTAAFAALVSAVAPGHSLAARHASGTESGSTSPGQLPPLANPSSLGLRGPSSPPEPSGNSGGAGSPGNSGGGSSSGNSGGGAPAGNSGGGAPAGNSGGGAPAGNSGGGGPAGNSGGGGVVSGGS